MTATIVDADTRTPRCAADELVIVTTRLTRLGLRPVYIEIDQHRELSRGMLLQFAYIDDLHTLVEQWGLIWHIRKPGRLHANVYASGVVGGVVVTAYSGTRQR